MSSPTWLPHVPKWVGQGVLWLLLYASMGSWFGFVTPPWESAAKDREALSAVTTRAQQAEQAIYLLQWQQEQTSRDLQEVKNKLDEMAMVLYSLERRSR